MKKFYFSRDGGMRVRGSYSVGYSEALASGLLPKKRAVAKFGEEVVSRCQAAEWHHGMAGREVDFFDPDDLAAAARDSFSFLADGLGQLNFLEKHLLCLASAAHILDDFWLFELLKFPFHPRFLTDLNEFDLLSGHLAEVAQWNYNVLAGLSETFPIFRAISFLAVEKVRRAVRTENFARTFVYETIRRNPNFANAGQWRNAIYFRYVRPGVLAWIEAHN